MLEVTGPGWRDFRLEHLVLDVNGALAHDGMLLSGASERVDQLRSILTIHLLSADTYGRLDPIARELCVPAHRLQSGESEVEQKAAFVRALGGATVVAVGNGANDVGMLREAALGIVVLGAEGTAVVAVVVADVLSASVGDAFDLLRTPRRLVATLRR